MAVSVQLTGIHQGADGKVTIQFGDGIGIEFRNKQDGIAWAGGVDAPTPENVDLLRKLLMAWWLKRDPTAATPATVVGKTITVDFAATPVLSVA